MISISPRKLSDLADCIYDWGQMVDSERGKTFEIEDFLFMVDNPRDRVCTQSWRKMNIGFAIVDALQHIVGDNKLQPLTQFVPAFSQYSTNGRTIDGAYGDRIHTNLQLDNIIKMLKANSQTRRAVLSIYMGVIDLDGGGGLNTPCTLNLHFIVRDGKLNMKAMMRSNDVILGLTNDIFTFTMLHEYVASQTGIPLGKYSHFTSSMHLYFSDAEKYHDKWTTEEPIWLGTMGSMPDYFDPRRLYGELCRLDKTSFEDALCKKFQTRYEENLYFAAACVYYRKNPSVRVMYDKIVDETLKRVVNLWI